MLLHLLFEDVLESEYELEEGTRFGGLYYTLVDKTKAIVAHCGAQYHGPDAYLWGMASSVKGCGTILMKKILDKLKTKGVRNAVLAVFRDNKRAVNLYLKMGFKVDEKEQNKKTLHMVKPLNGNKLSANEPEETTMRWFEKEIGGRYLNLAVEFYKQYRRTSLVTIVSISNKSGKRLAKLYIDGEGAVYNKVSTKQKPIPLQKITYWLGQLNKSNS